MSVHCILQKRQTWSATLPLVNHCKSQINFFICSSHRYTIIKGCCQWKDQERPTLAEVNKKLASGEKAASDKVIKASGTVDIEQYLKEAGYGEANSYTVFWLQLSSAKALLQNKKMKFRCNTIAQNSGYDHSGNWNCSFFLLSTVNFGKH